MAEFRHGARGELESVAVTVLKWFLLSDSIGLMRVAIAEAPRFPDLASSVYALRSWPLARWRLHGRTDRGPELAHSQHILARVSELLGITLPIFG